MRPGLNKSREADFCEAPRVDDDGTVKVYLDNELIPDAGDSLRDALGIAVAKSDTAGRVIVEAVADGVAVPGDHLADPPERAPYAGELRLVSVEPRSLVRDAFQEAGKALMEMRSTQRKIAESIHAGDTASAMNNLQDVVSTWSSTKTATEDGCSLLGLSPDEFFSTEPTSGQSPFNCLLECLGELKRAVATEDWPAIADTLEFELTEQAEDWSAKLESAAARLA